MRKILNFMLRILLKILRFSYQFTFFSN